MGRVMEKRRLGKTDLFVSPVGYGCMGLTHAFGEPLPKEQAIKIIRSAYEMGYNFFDTAECYTGEYQDGTVSYNEEIVGEALKPYRDKVVIATKFGVRHKGMGLVMDSSPETIRKSLEGSLKRLQTDYIDIYYQHRIDPKVEPEVVAGVMKELIAEGKIRHWGISEANEEYLRRAHKVCPVTVIQNRYSMIARWHENLFSVCDELGITYVAFSPLANGFLSGMFDGNSKFTERGDYRASMPQYTKEGFESAKGLMSFLKDLANQKNATIAQISLAWMLNKNKNLVPIPGSKNVQRIKENLLSAEINLTDSEIETIDKFLDKIDVPVFGGH